MTALGLREDMPPNDNRLAEHPEDKNTILLDGPWSIMNSLLVLQPLEDGMVIPDLEFSKCPLWIQVHGLPIKKMTRSTVELLGRRVGSLLGVEAGPGVLASPYIGNRHGSMDLVRGSVDRNEHVPSTAKENIRTKVEDLRQSHSPDPAGVLIMLGGGQIVLQAPSLSIDKPTSDLDGPSYPKLLRLCAPNPKIDQNPSHPHNAPNPLSPVGLPKNSIRYMTLSRSRKSPSASKNKTMADFDSMLVEVLVSSASDMELKDPSVTHRVGAIADVPDLMKVVLDPSSHGGLSHGKNMEDALSTPQVITLSMNSSLTAVITDGEIDRAIFQPPDCIVEVVGDLIDSNTKAWKEDGIRSLVSREEAEFILSIPISQVGNIDSLVNKARKVIDPDHL
ncbi:hypothetical protein RHSIM_RhsimUnG0231800 [Rhododendron simsii]|uniref:DUF4283 domain-containing protein n=1 Tax=Rhododendron simsii TaxID=118357 RepID=A0A834L3D3_RHOSS|nr:hypothetical protein RHSIM_RhsimUnG0231800 [Rhododendron simsii]